MRCIRGAEERRGNKDAGGEKRELREETEEMTEEKERERVWRKVDGFGKLIDKVEG